MKPRMNTDRHGLNRIGANEYNSDRRDAMHRVSTNTQTNTPKNQFGAQRKNLA